MPYRARVQRGAAQQHAGALSALFTSEVSVVTFLPCSSWEQGSWRCQPPGRGHSGCASKHDLSQPHAQQVAAALPKQLPRCVDPPRVVAIL